MAELYRYAAFISYSSKDARFAQRLHRALEGYGIPSSLGKFDLIGGGKKNRIYPVFRDREELSAGQLGDQIEANLKASAALIVVCSPNAAASPWVEKEIEFFAGLGRHGKIFSIIADDAPLTDASGADATASCFPPAFRGDALAGDKLEPLAADARKSKDGFRNAWLKVVAGMIGVSPGQIIDRDKARRRRQRLVQIAATGLGAAVMAIAGGAVSTWQERSNFARHSAQFVDAGFPHDGGAFSIASLPPSGAIFAFGGFGADRAVQQSGVIQPVVAQIPEALAAQWSNDSRFLVVLSNAGEGTLYDANDFSAPALSLGGDLLAQYSAFDFSPRARFLVVRSDDLSARLFDLHDLAGAATPLGRIRSVAFSNDDTLLAVQHDDFSGEVRLSSRPNAEGVLLGQLSQDFPFEFSPDGRYIEYARDDGSVWLASAREPLIAPIRLNGQRFVGFSANGRFAGSQDLRGSLTLYDIANLVRAFPSQETGGYNHFSPSGRYLAIQQPDSMVSVVDLTDTDRTQRFGPLLGVFPYAFAGGGRFMITVDVGNSEGMLHDLDSGVSYSLGRTNTIAPPSSARWLAIEDADGFWSLRDLRHLTLTPIPIGHLHQYSMPAFSPNDHLLMTFDRNSTIVIRDVTMFASEAKGAALREEVCTRSAGALMPTRVDSNISRSQGLSEALVGRPWNPCDWRGLLAIFPDAERGDGWFEGVRQWWRLVQTRYFGGRDWACEETTSAASEQTRVRRRDMCARFAAPVEESPA